MLQRLAASFAFVVTATAPALALEVGDAAPCVVLENVSSDGSSVDQCIRERNDPDQRYTLLEFFSVTCSACAANLPIVNSLADEVRGTTQTRFVAIDRSRDAILAYRAATPLLARFPVALDVARDAKRAYDVVLTPTLYVLDADYMVVYKHEGILSTADVAAIKEVVAP